MVLAIARTLSVLLAIAVTLAPQSSALAWLDDGDRAPSQAVEVTSDQVELAFDNESTQPDAAVNAAGPLLSDSLQPLQELGISLIGFETACDGCDTCGANCSGCFGGCHCCGCDIKPAPCVDCPRVSTASPYFNVNFFGALKLDMLFNDARPVAPGTPFFLAPQSQPGFDENTFDAHARQTNLGAIFSGPQFGGFQSGGTFLAMLYNDAVIVDQYGFLPLQAWGELKNDRWRFSAGLQFDVFSPGIPTVLPFSALAASGNAGNSFRGQVRLERFFQLAADHQWTLQFALSDPITTTIDPTFSLLEDNGWPNVEGRVALGLGCLQGLKRPLELGLSGVVGQLRSTQIPVRQQTADVWGVNLDLYWKATDSIGIAGEIFTGQGLGTYNAGVLQTLNATTLDAIATSGGWIETFVYWTPAIHSHFGYGIDNPDDDDLSLGARTKNETYFANAIWDVNATFRIAGEIAWRETEYADPLDNEGIGFHTQFQWAF